ncbi:nitrate reductase [Clostridium carboxidivorans P7]|uniref:4Fe-4S ferredoxin iron-sulfur binding domain protein n=1 Tax=Clostridium carboxidivorans P7 TaxID=536227 RepID=C6Q2K0_9CLOT|nr:4Fe-4S dicluster domain-containing protein [Clostridium carboxidivorans]AKN29497.1 nitrate reductase [Clostridium carboxidivorans P7]EET84278.1 4Fe-4S ferredoxin iron-sulfur binding domain protein [Clostridium carboxidivorans P7]EFG89581.1 4Fe-4S binding domain protein [Clostridium carboxidivorans P7]
MKRIKIDRSKCIGCLTCVTACIVSHESSDSRNRVTIDSKTKPAPIFCRHCDKPECVYTCMTGAMSKDRETGLVQYDKERCASCYMCIMACPYGVLKSDRIEYKEIMKCNMCVHRTENNEPKPMCVEKCPMGAITLEEA